MTLLGNFIKKKNGAFGPELSAIFKEVIDSASHKSGQKTDEFFAGIGEELLRSGINSAFCIFNEKKDSFSVKHIALTPEYSAVFGALPAHDIRIGAFPLLKQAMAEKKPFFDDKAAGKLSQIFPEMAAGELEKENPLFIGAPLVIQNDAIGLLALLSPRFRAEDLFASEQFAQKIVFLLTGKILYQEIKKTEKRYEELWDQAPIAYHTLDTRGTIREVNKAGAKLMGYAKAEMIGRPIFDFILPEQQADARKRFTLKLEGRNPKKKNRVYVRKDGARIFVSVKDTLEKDVYGKVVSVHTTILDYTNRYKAESALRASEEKYRSLASNAEDGVIVLNEEGYIVFVNSAMKKISGYSEAELRSRPFFEFLHADDKHFFCELFRRGISGEKREGAHEYRLIAKKGELKHISGTSAAFREKGRVAGIQSILRDITENKELAEKIKRSKKNFQQIIDTIQTGICVIDRKFTIASCNRTFWEKTGLPVKEILGRPCRMILPLYENGVFHNHCTNNACGENCGTAGVFRTGEAVDYVEVSRAEGENHYHKISIFPAKDSQGQVYQVVMTIKNVSRQMRAETEYKKLSEFNTKILNTAPISIVALDKGGMIITANRLAEQLMGRSGKSIIGRELTETKEIKSNKDLQQLYSRLLDKGEAFYYENLSYIASLSGQEKFLNIIAVPLHNVRNEPDGALSMAIDNTEAVLNKQKLENLNKNLEKIIMERTHQLDAANKRLLDAMRLKTKFIADASHELRTPLTVIQGNLDLAVREAGEAGDFPETLEAIMGEVKRMTGILSDLTMLTNTDTDMEKLRKENINLGALTKAAGQSLRVLAEQKKITLIYKKGAKNIKVKADGDKIEKLLLNILRNAIKYTNEKGKIELWVDTDGNYARIHIKDNGIGIPKDDLPYIFERFYRVDKARSRAEGGTGLGLSICKWIAEAHDGHIGVESEYNKGSVFTVYLPLEENGPRGLGLQFKN